MVKKIIIVFLLLITLFLLGLFIEFQSSPEADNINHDHDSIIFDPNTTFKPIKEIKKANSQDLYSSLNFNCESADIECISAILNNLTEDYGPKVTLEATWLLIENDKISKAIDAHKLAHVVGNNTAKTFGVGKQAFLLCPPEYFGGCHHGYLESVLLSVPDAKKTVETEICQKLNNNAELVLFNCYHGIGHGLLMIDNHKIGEALFSCDTIKSKNFREWCWSGVFNGASMTESVDYFASENVMEPCEKIEDKYLKECFKNLVGPHLVTHYGSVNKAAVKCIELDKVKDECAQLMGSFAAYRTYEISKKMFGEIVEICHLMPQEYIEGCIGGAVQRLIFNEPIEGLASVAREFCSQLDFAYKENCFDSLGENLSIITFDNQLKGRVCGLIPSEYISVCRVSAKIT